MNTHVARTISAFGIAGIATASAWFGTAIAKADPHIECNVTVDQSGNVWADDCDAFDAPFDQRSFPCQEDEVLGYAPQFGPDRVGCIHIDQLRSELA